MIRTILIYHRNIPIISDKLIQQLDSRHTTIKHIQLPQSNTSPNKYNQERLELYGYDGTLKYTTKNISSRTKLATALKTCITKIDKMPMGSIEKQTRNSNITRKRLLTKCGLPDIQDTQHCFADRTHHTCCMLGPKAREYADSSGNPIGSLSVRIQRKTNIKTKKQGLTPWCTCTGSKVCSYYSGKFGREDGTHIKFIGSSKSKNENKAILEMGLMRHETPGIL
jgi:hypothetical protein